MKHGDIIWVDNDVLGYPPTPHVFGTITDGKIMYKEPGPDGSIGCKISVAHASLTKALATAIIKGNGS